MHNMASTGPVLPVVGNGGQLLSRISRLNELVHFKAELRDLGLVYQIMNVMLSEKDWPNLIWCGI